MNRRTSVAVLSSLFVLLLGVLLDVDATAFGLASGALTALSTVGLIAGLALTILVAVGVEGVVLGVCLLSVGTTTGFAWTRAASLGDFRCVRRSRCTDERV